MERLSDQLLDAKNAIIVQVSSKVILDLRHNLLVEILVGENLVGESACDEVLGRDAVREKESLVGLGETHALDKHEGRGAFGDQAERGERGENVGALGNVDKVGMGDEGGREADCWAVQGCNENLGVLKEGLGGVEVVEDDCSHIRLGLGNVENYIQLCNQVSRSSA